MTVPMNEDNLNKIVQSCDMKLDLKPKQRETLVYRRMGTICSARVWKILRNDGLLSEPSTDEMGMIGTFNMRRVIEAIMSLGCN